MRTFLALLAAASLLAAPPTASAQGPVNPRQSSGSGGDRQAVPRGSAPAGGGPSGAQSAPPPATTGDQGGARARTAVPRPAPRDDERTTIVVVPGARAGASYYYRGRFYPYYPYGSAGVFGGSPYWYPPHQRVIAQPYPRPTGRRYGELRLRVRPRSAEVYVDGYYAGRVDDFDGTFQALRLLPGPHHIEVIAPGYEVLEFEVGPAPRGKITYEGDLEPAPRR